MGDNENQSVATESILEDPSPKRALHSPAVCGVRRQAPGHAVRGGNLAVQDFAVTTATPVQSTGSFTRLTVRTRASTAISLFAAHRRTRKSSRTRSSFGCAVGLGNTNGR